MSKVVLTIQYNEGTTSVPAQVPVPNSTTPGALGRDSGIGIDEHDPLGLGEIRLTDIDVTAVNAVTAAAAARPAGPEMPAAPATLVVTLTGPITELVTDPAPQPPSDLLDLASIADMARRVEDARFAAERRLHESVRAMPAAPHPPQARSSIDPVVRRMAAEAKTASAVPTEIALANSTQLAQVPVQASPPAPPSPPSVERRAPSRHSSVSEATAALRDLLADDVVPVAAPATEPEPAAPPRPAPIRGDAEPVRAAGFTDTASLLRELASLSGDDEPARPAPTGSGPRPAIRTMSSQSKNAKRKGLFTR